MLNFQTHDLGHETRIVLKISLSLIPNKLNVEGQIEKQFKKELKTKQISIKRIRIKFDIKIKWQDSLQFWLDHREIREEDREMREDKKEKVV